MTSISLVLNHDLEQEKLMAAVGNGKKKIKTCIVKIIVHENPPKMDLIIGAL